MTNQPNIFNYATSELSQDAFIAWLLSWANKKYKSENKQLYQLGLDFLHSLLAKQNIAIAEISNLEIKTQFYKIDVFVSFQMDNKHYGIIIEDKVHTIDHNNQLERYINKIKELSKETVIVPIYFKTGYQVNLNRIKDNGYYHYSVKDFSRVITLEKIKEISNDVLTQYYIYLNKKENEYDWADNQAKNYSLKPIAEWTWWSCVRFFHEYKTTFKAGWGSVPNNREPLLAFWFGGRTFTFNEFKFEMYMDIQFIRNKVDVCYRLGLFNTKLKDVQLRNDIFKAFLPYLKSKGIEVKRPKFSQAKKSILLARISNLDRTLHYLNFVEQIKEYQNLLNTFVNDYNAKQV